MPTTVIGAGLNVNAIFPVKTTTITASKGGTGAWETLIDTGTLDKPIEIIKLVYICESTSGDFRLVLYNKDGSEANISYSALTTNALLDYIDIYSFPGQSIEKTDGLFRMTDADSSQNCYVLVLNRPLKCYGFRIESYESSGDVHRVAVTYQEYEV